MSTNAVDVAMIIARSEEFDEFIEGISAQSRKIDGEYYYEFTHPGSGKERPYQCVVTSVGGMDEGPMAVCTQKMIANYDPALSVVLGIAGALDKDVHVGDVLAVTQVDNYLASAKAKEGLNDRYVPFVLSGKVYNSTFGFVQICKHLKTAHPQAYQRWLAACEQKLVAEIPDVEVRQRLINENIILDKARLFADDIKIASGPILGAATEFTQWLLNYRDRHFHAIEMESAGFMYTMWRQVEYRKTLILRGISDYADERKRGFDNIKDGALRRYALNNIKQLLWTLMELDELERNP